LQTFDEFERIALYPAQVTEEINKQNRLVCCWQVGRNLMLEVHAPHERIHGLKDFFLHLFTITVGLLIALSLEGLVEWQHHRHLVHEAESGLRGEIQANTQVIASQRQRITNERKELDGNLQALAVLRAHADAHQHMSFTFQMASFDDVTWKTAQTTGAFAYMPYEDAHTYSDIYAGQAELYKVQQEIAEDAMRAASLVVNKPDGERVTPAEIDAITERIGLIQMRLLLLENMVDHLDKTYQKFLSEHR
jgi:hypothetical protein